MSDESWVYAMYEDEVDSGSVTRGRCTMVVIKNVNFHVIVQYFFILIFI